MNAAGAFNGLPRELRNNISPICLATLITRDRWRFTPTVPMQRPDRGNREQAAASACYQRAHIVRIKKDVHLRAKKEGPHAGPLCKVEVEDSSTAVPKGKKTAAAPPSQDTVLSLS